MTAIGAVMHKLCNIVFAVLRDEKPFVLITPEEHCNAYSKHTKLPICNLQLTQSIAV